MPWRAVLQSKETQQAFVGLVFEALKLALPLLNTIRLHRLERKVSRHHAVCKEHRNNERIHH